MLVVGPHITRRSAAALRDAGIQFVDALGIAFVSFDGILVLGAKVRAVSDAAGVSAGQTHDTTTHNDHPLYLSADSALGVGVMRPTTVTVYVDALDPKLAVVNRWSASRDRPPDVFVRHKFWVSPLCDVSLLRLVDAVTAELSATSSQLQPDNVMVVGAACRDILHSSLKHTFPLRATEDIDIGLAALPLPTAGSGSRSLPVTPR